MTKKPTLKTVLADVEAAATSLHKQTRAARAVLGDTRLVNSMARTAEWLDRIVERSR